MSGRKKVLITGGTGYIGSSLVSRLVEIDTVDVIVVVRDMKKAEEMFHNSVEYILYKNLEQFTLDISQFSPEVVVHLAAYSTSSDTAEDVSKLIEANIVFTSHLLLALSEINLELFINAGSFSEYHTQKGEISPTYFYSTTKTSARYMVEYFSKRNGFMFINTILYSVYGKKTYHKKIVDYALESLNASSSVAMSEGNQLLDFVHIDDIVALYCNLIENYTSLQPSKINYDIGTGECHTIREMVTLVEDITGKRANIEWGVYKSRKLDTVRACADIEDAVEELGYRVRYRLREGLKSYIESIK